MIRSFRDKALQAYFETGQARRLSVRNVERIGRILRALDDATAPEQLNLPGYYLHVLRGERRWSIRVTGNWRITFGWDANDAIDVEFGGLSLMAKRPIKRGLPPMHPGELLREDVMPALDRPLSDIARLLGVSRQTLHAILNERQPVTPLMALKLGKLCGNGPDLWLALQARYDLAKLGKERRTEIAAIPTLAAE